MAGVSISSPSSQSLRLYRLSSFSPSRFALSSIRSSSSRLFTTVSCRRAAAPSLPPLSRTGGRCIAAFVDLDKVPYALTDDPPFEDVKIVEEIKVVEDLGGGFGSGVGGNEEGDGFGGGDSGDGGDDGDGGEGRKGEGGGESGKGKKMSGMSMSQKLTLGYAALVGVGGFMGYMKSGSQKSLAAGGGSALLLYYVYTQLPVRPTFASSLGLGLSAALLTVMGSRFKRSGKIFPAGVVSIVSFIMAGGYLHGILRSFHA